ncbi:MAG: hypothetical protein ACRENX_06180 [Candidatus Dormibacteria bacterium]
MRACTQTQVDEQLIPWNESDFWVTAFGDHPHLLAELMTEVQEKGGIARSFVFAHSTSDPVELFLVAMAWGFGRTNIRWPKQRAMLMPQFRESAAIASIVSETQKNGAGAGWSALWGRHHVPGLGAAFGTKLLYFSGYREIATGLRPLILDANVRRGLAAPETGLQEKFGYWRADYERYLAIAQSWADDPEWGGTPEVVEFALFEWGKNLAAARPATKP